VKRSTFGSNLIAGYFHKRNGPFDNRTKRKGYTMSRKDYELIASVIKSIAYDTALDQLGATSKLRILSMRMANKLKEENPRFNSETFERACGF
jgi:hypothetical protein